MDESKEVSQEDGFADLCDAIQLYWDDVSEIATFEDLCQSFQLFDDEDDNGSVQSILLKVHSMVGREEVKELFREVMTKVETAKRQGVTLYQEDLRVKFVGNPGLGRRAIEKLYDRFLKDLGCPSRRRRGWERHSPWSAYSTDDSDESSDDKKVQGPATLQFTDFSDNDLLQELAKLFKGRFGDKMSVQGGIGGLYSRILVRRVGRGREKPGFRNFWALKDAFSKVCSRQVDRIHWEHQAGKHPDYFYFTKDDLIGPEPSQIQSQAWDRLQRLVGLEQVKASVQTLLDRIRTNYHRELQEKQPIHITLNSVILGPPGTGKSTVARLYGQILSDFGYLSNGKVVVKNPSDFIAPYLGQSERRTKDILKEARGGTLVIDDAHMLHPRSRLRSHDNIDNYRIAVVDTLVAEIQNIPGEDRCVILVGYPEQMQELFHDSNPGLARRFSFEDAFHFESFDRLHLGGILDLKLREQDLQVTSAGKDVALEVLCRAQHRPHFGNGGEVENLLSQAKAAYQKRISKATPVRAESEAILEPQDFDAQYNRALRSSESGGSVFEDLVGCESIIKRFRDYRQAVIGMRLRDIDPRPCIPFNFLFKGPPGSGKTTTARRVGQLFYDMGFLSRPEVVECSVSDLVAHYEGQTGHKVVKLLEQSLGKVLFIDEAYRLRDGNFAREAVGELVDCLTKQRYERKLVVVLAGYEEDINKLMLANRGLRGRFATDVVFPRISPEQCLLLLQRNMSKLQIETDEEFRSGMKTRAHILEIMHQLTAKYSWANGRDIETLGERIAMQVFKSQAEKGTADGRLVISSATLIELLKVRSAEIEVADLETAISATPEDSREQPGLLASLGRCLSMRYERMGDVTDLENAISLTRQAIVAAPEDHTDRAGRLSNLSTYLSSRYERTGNINDLEEAISSARQAVAATPEDHPDRAGWLSNLSNHLSSRYERTGNINDLEEAISSARQAVAATPEDHPDRAGWLSNLSNHLSSRYERTGNINDLEEAISSARQAIAATPEDHPDRAGRLSNLSNGLSNQYERTGNIDDLEEAISSARQAIAATPEDHPDQAGRLSNLSNRLSSRYERTGNINDLEEAISSARQAVAATPEDHPDRAGRLSNLSNHLSSRYERTGNINDLEEAISSARQAIAAIPENHPNRAGRLSNLSTHLSSRYERTGNIKDLEEAISSARQAIAATPEDHPDRAGWLSNLASHISSRHKRTGNINDLEEAISSARQAIAATPEDHPDQAGRLSNLSNRLSSRYERTGNINDLEEAISSARQAVAATPEDHPDRAGWLSNLSNHLSSRYERTGNINDLEEAISSARQAIAATPEDHPDRAGRLSNLSNGLSNQYERTGNIDDLEEAISSARQAIAATPENHPDRAYRLNNLSYRLSSRYERKGNINDLEEAISSARQAVAATPEDHPDRAGWLSNLSNHLSSRYERTGNINDLEEAISSARQAIAAIPENHPNRAGRLNNLSNRLSSRYKQTGNINDLEEAISSARQAIAATFEDHPNRAGRLSNLASRISSQYERTGNINDLEEAISSAHQAIAATPEDHPDRAGWLSNLGGYQLKLFRKTHDRAYEDSALSNFEESAQCSSSVPLRRLHATRRAIQILNTRNMWEKAGRLAQEAVHLLPLVCGRYLRRQDQQHAILQTSGLAADACSLSLKMGNLKQALEQIEFGRGLILGYLIDNHSDLSVLRDGHPDLADEFDQLRLKISRPTDSREHTILHEAEDERQKAIRRLDDCLNRIRCQRGHERFLMEPTLDELTQAAEEGPIVIVNMTDISSDAIIVTRSGAERVELPDMTPAKATFLDRDFGSYRSTYEHDEEQSRDIQSETEAITKYSTTFLTELWTSCVQPILAELPMKRSGPTEIPRIWWIGTGVASSLPFHAAGDYSGSVPRDVLDQTISSYTPTIKSLVHARSCAARSVINKDEKVSVLVVAMPETPGQIPLPGVAEEMAAVQHASGEVFTFKQLMQPSVEQVMGGMRQSDIVHFACHGSSDRTDPSASHLLLQKATPSGLVVERLTLQQISDSQTLGKARIAYLSACSTAEVKARPFADEALHIVSAFQVAGFGHVIGSLWSADDSTSARVAGLFYECLIKDGGGQITNRAIAEALRDAILQVRQGLDPRLWAPYIHSGA